MQALRSLETGLDGWSLPKNWKRMTRQQLEYGLRVPNPERMVVLKQVLEFPSYFKHIWDDPTPQLGAHATMSGVRLCAAMLSLAHDCRAF